MAWSVDNIFEFTKFITNKNLAGGISAKDLFYAWNPEQQSYMQDLLGRFQNRNNGKEGANTGLIQNETIMQKLSPFILSASIPIENITIGTPIATLPEDFVYKLSARINNEVVYQVNPSQIFSVVKSVIDPPSRTDQKYYYTQYENYYKILPENLLLVDSFTLTLDYVRQPNDIVWGYIIAPNGQQIYNSGTSVQPEWDDLSIIEITKRTLKALGVRFKDADFVNFGNSNIATGD